MKLFEFAKTKPTPVNIWKELEKTEYSTSEKTLIWAATVLTTDFSKFKDSLHMIGTEELTLEQFIEAITEGIESQHSVSISVTLPFSDLLKELETLCVLKSLTKPLALLMYWLISSTSSEDDVLNLANKFKNIKKEEFHNIIRNNHSSLEEVLEFLTPVNVLMLNDKTLFAENIFRQLFPADSFKKPEMISGNVDLFVKKYLRTGLIEAIKDGKKVFGVPTFEQFPF